jgi:hypothetical protein
MILNNYDKFILEIFPVDNVFTIIYVYSFLYNLKAIQNNGLNTFFSRYPTINI